MAVNNQPEFNGLRLRLNNFPSNESVIDFCERFQLIPTRAFAATHAKCPHCSSPMKVLEDISYKIGWRLRCFNELCDKTWNPLQGTWFERAHLTWVQVMDLVFCFVAKGMCSLQFACDVADCTPKTSIDWWVFMREVCAHYVDNATQIGCPMGTVEIDESHLYRPKYHHGRGLGDVWVVGGICRETKDLFIERVENRLQQTTDDIIRRRVAPGSIIMTDGWAGYTGLMARFGEYDGDIGFADHFVVIHEEGFTGNDQPIPSLENTPGVIKVHTNTIERVWRDLKYNIKSTQEHTDLNTGEIHRMADSYIERYIYFRNVLKNINDNGQRFRQFLEDVKVLYPFNAAACFHQPDIPPPGSVPLIGLDEELNDDMDDDFGVLPN